MYEYKEELTKEFILSRISEEDIFNKYLNIYPNTTDYFTNPLREDTHPDCKFYRDARGVLKFKDFAYKMNIDCFNLVQLIDVNCKSFKDVLRKVAKDFNLYGQDINKEVVANWERAVAQSKSIFSSIRVKRKEFTRQELEWWRNEGVSKETLERYKVSSLQFLWLNNSLVYEYKPSDFGFVQQFGEGYSYKAYFPLRKNYRFLQNVSDILQGYEQLPERGDFLVITQSNKAVMSMSEFDIPAVAQMSESVLVSENSMLLLRNRFPLIFTLYDPDRTGMWMSQMMRKKYKTIPLLFDRQGLFVKKGVEPKDWNEQFKKFGLQYMLDLIEETKENYRWLI